MKAECKLAIDNAAASLGLKAPRIDDIEARVIAEIKQMALRDKQAFASMSQNERLAAAGKTVYESAMIEASIDRANAARQIKADAINQGYLDKTAPIVGSNMKAMHHNIAMIADGKGGGIPLETAIKSKTSVYMSQLAELWKLEKEGSFAGILTTKEGSIALAKEAFGIDSGMPQAKLAWKALEKINGMIADDLRNVGAKIGKLDNYRFPQVQDTLRVLQTTAKEYVDRMMTVVDRGMYVDLKGDMLDDAKMRTFLEEAYVTVASDGHSKSPSEGGHGSTVNRHKAHRMIHYKSHEAYIQAMEWYGAGSLFDQIKSHVSNASRDITLMEKFGPNAEYAFKRMMAEAVSKDTREGVHKPNLEAKVQWIFDSMNGKQNIVNANIAQGFSNFRSMIVANKLGSLLFAQTSDLATVKATAEAIGVHMSEVMNYAAKFATDSESRAMIASIGHGLDAVSNGVVRFADAADTTSIFGKAATAVVTIQGAQAWTNILRQAFAATMHSHYGRLTRQYASLTDLPTQDRLVLESKGVTETDWKLWKSSGVDDGNILSWRNINQITTADILKANPEIRAGVEARSKEFMDRMTAQNIKEAGWVSGREGKFSEYKVKIQSMIDGFTQTRDKRLEDMSARSLDRAYELMLKMDRAEVDMEIARKSIEAMNERRSDKFMEDVKRGMEWYGRRRSEIGERLGATRHSTKLAEAKLDRAYVSESERLIAKANELFGPERVEDGLVAMGKVTKAQKEFDAYAAKMEKRIDNATKNNGTPKKGKEGTIERAKLLSEQAKLELEVIIKNARDAMDDLRKNIGDNQKELSGLIEAVDGKRKRAENEADMASFIELEKNLDKVQGLVDILNVRSNQSVDRGASAGERLGYKKAMADSRIRQMDKDMKSAERTAGKEVFAKATELEKRIDKRMAELDEFTRDMQERAGKRESLMNEHQAKIGDVLAKEANDFRDQSAMKLQAMVVEETHMAVLQPSLSSQYGMSVKNRGDVVSEIGGMVFMFKNFPWALLQQHFIERANFAASGKSPAWYRAKLAAYATVTGGITLMLADLASGKNPRPMDTTEQKLKFIRDSMVRGGAMPILTDVFEAGSAENPTLVVAKAMGGPAAGLLGATAGAVQGGGKWAISGFEDEKARVQFTKNAYKMAKETVSGQNFWFARGVIHNVMLDDVQEMANPGSTQRAKEQLRKRTGQEYFLGME